jgi:DNA repair protein RadC
MREPRLTLDDAAAPERPLRRTPAARLLKAERVQTQAEHRPGRLPLPHGPAAPSPAASEVAEAALAFDDAASDASFTVSRFHLRLVEEKPDLFAEPPPKIRRPLVAARLLWSLVFEGEPREVMAVLLLDAHCRPFGYHVAYTGMLSSIAVEPRQILVTALLANAAAILVAHNHPSGEVASSRGDLLFTRRLANAAEEVGVSLLDHLIVGSDRGQVRFRSLFRRDGS